MLRSLCDKCRDKMLRSLCGKSHINICDKRLQSKLCDKGHTNVKVSELEKQMPRLDQLYEFRISNAYKNEDLKKKLDSESSFDQGYFLY